MKKKVTSTDIARAAGVSQSTVSMILNKKYDVSFAKETVEKVENAAKELGYVPPKRKTRKGTKREKLLVVFCPNLTNPYYVMLLQGIEAHAKEKGFGLFVCNTQRDLRMEERYLKMMWYLRWFLTSHTPQLHTNPQLECLHRWKGRSPPRRWSC